MATSSLAWENKYSTTLSAGITASDTTIPLNTLPVGNEGFLVIEPDSASNYEVIYYTSKTGSEVVCPSVGAGRGQDGTSAVSHSSGATVKMLTVAAMFEALQDGSALAAGSIKPSNLISGAGSTWPMQAYTPTWTNCPVLNSTVDAKYIQIGKIVFVRIKVTFAGGDKPSGTVSVSLPTSAISTDYGDRGSAQYQDTGTQTFPGTVAIASTTTVSLVAFTVSGSAVIRSVVNGTSPHTWADTDILSLNFWYEAP